VPARKASGLDHLVIQVDTRERYPYRFPSHRSVETVRTALPAGDYSVGRGDDVIAAVERKTIENFRATLVDGSLGFVMAELAALPAAAVVVEGRYSQLFGAEHVQPGWLPELVARLQVRYSSVPIAFAETGRGVDVPLPGGGPSGPGFARRLRSRVLKAARTTTSARRTGGHSFAASTLGPWTAFRTPSFRC
jgi:hypothetical protein